MTYRLPVAAVVVLSLAHFVQTAVAQQSAPAGAFSTQANAAVGAALASAPNQAPIAQPGIAGQQPPGQPGGTPVQPVGPPFQINELEQQFVLQTLQMWEQKSSEVETFNADFERWEYDAVFGPGANTPIIKAIGKLSFSKPDKGSFRIEKINRWTKKDPQSMAADAPGAWTHQPEEIGEHWVCDGKAIYEYQHRDKQLVVTTIPPEMRGQNIVEGPLPFLFGAKADRLMTRYWIRTKQSTETDIWLEAYPRWASDAVNYNSVDVMLDRKSMQPKAIQVNLPGGQQRHTYMFTSMNVNEKNLGAWFTGLFSSPRTPLGWKKVMADEAAAAPQAANPQAPIQR